MDYFFSGCLIGFLLFWLVVECIKSFKRQKQYDILREREIKSLEKIANNLESRE